MKITELITGKAVDKKPFTDEDVDLLVSQFGRSIDNVPQVYPEFNNYYQHIEGGMSKLGNLTRLNGEPMFAPGESEYYEDFTFSWFVNNEHVTSKQDPTLNDLKEFSGVVWLRLDIEHLPTGARYYREKWAYFGYNDLEDTVIEGAPDQFNVFSPFFLEQHRENYTYFSHDLNQSGQVEVQDLLELLAGHVNIQ